jgi:hypothetical protein
MTDTEKLQFLLSKLQETAEQKHLQDDDDFENDEYYNPADNGNYDDAFYDGVKCGGIEFARSLLRQLNSN